MIGGKTKKQVDFDLGGKIYVGILAAIFGLIILHAPIVVGLETLWPKYDLLIKSWKEILMLIAGLLALYLIFKNKKTEIFKDPLILAILAYAVLHLLLSPYNFQGWAAWGGGPGNRFTLFAIFRFGLHCPVFVSEPKKTIHKNRHSRGVGGASLCVFTGVRSAKGHPEIYRL